MNSFGKLFKVSVYGESHGNSVGVIIDGVPSGIKIEEDDFTIDLLRRKAGAIGTTTRFEEDVPYLNSGVFNNFSTGSPLMINFLNKNTISKDYTIFKEIPRPSHADFVSEVKYNGFQDYRGGGHFSGRVTVGIVAAGVIAKKITNYKYKTEIINLGGETNKSRFKEILSNLRDEDDSLGGIVEIRVNNLPVGLGEPYFDSVESYISHLLFSVGGVKGVEFGLGFKGVELKGSQFNDMIIDKNGTTKTNNNGGINGGITNGNELVIRVMIKPTPSILKKQETFNFKTNKMDVLNIEGRHDNAIIIRGQVVLEAMVAIALADLTLINNAYKK